MEINYKEYFSNLSSYEEYVIKCNLLGKEPNDPKILNSGLFHTEFFDDKTTYWTVVNGRIMFIDQHTGKNYSINLIRGTFSCSYDDNLTSLEGAPQRVGGSFHCSSLNITSLEGAPQRVGGLFMCSDTKITSLKGAPEEVGESFNCSFNSNLTSLAGAPRKIGERRFTCDNTKVPREEIKAYREFLRHPTPEHIDETGHYKP